VFADVSIHTAHDERNIHAHVLLSHRELGPDGFGEIANRRTITRKHRGQVKEMTTAGIASTPADVKFLRKEWADHVNSAYQRTGHDIRVDHRSFEDRGLQKVPTIHLGPQATAMERQGKHSERGDINRIIEFGNGELQRLEGEKQRQDAEIIDLQKALADRLAQPPTTPRTDEAENYSKQQGDEITAEKAQPMQTPDDHSANQNDRDPPLGYRIGASVSPAFGPETIAASSKHRRPEESEAMDEDIAAKQRQQRQEIEDREAARYNDMVAERNRADRYVQEWQRAHDYGERNRRHLQEAQWRREAESDITDVNARALLAAGESRDFVQAVRREGAMITQEHADLQRDIALEKDPDKKHLLKLKRDIQHADYMALANERIAAMSNLNGEQYKEALRQQEAWSNAGTELRKERLELQEHMANQEMDTINQAVEQMNTADKQRAEFRADIRGYADAQQEAAPGAAQEAAETHEAHAAASVTGQSERLARAPQRPADAREAVGEQEPSAAPAAPGIAHLRTSGAENGREGESTREMTDARQAEGDTAEHAEMTDPKAAKKAALARNRSATEQSIQQGQERSYENSR
jgi:hypothetical protein